MPLISGQVERYGAAVTALVGVNAVRAERLRGVGFPVPEPIAVQGIIDTGAEISGVATRVVRELGLQPVESIWLLTPSTPTSAPSRADVYHVSLTLVSGTTRYTIPDLRVIATDCFRAGERAEALLGLNLLNRCTFVYAGCEQQFSLSFPNPPRS